MAGGNSMTRSSNFRNENDDNESIEPDFVNARVDPEGTTPNNLNSSIIGDKTDLTNVITYIFVTVTFSNLASHKANVTINFC